MAESSVLETQADFNPLPRFSKPVQHLADLLSKNYNSYLSPVLQAQFVVRFEPHLSHGVLDNLSHRPLTPPQYQIRVLPHFALLH